MRAGYHKGVDITAPYGIKCLFGFLKSATELFDFLKQLFRGARVFV
jgi:hypothetical protein